MMEKVKIFTIGQVEKILMHNAGQGGFVVDHDGKLKRIVNEGTNSPWYMIRGEEKKDCMYWGNLIGMEGFGRGESFIPLTCQNCWKVVARPQTIVELFKVIEILKRSGQTCKCGIEMRPEVGALYGSYWYNETLEDGRECYKRVKKEVEENLLPGTKILLKRGCTEFELGHGDSLYWEPFDGQEEIEEYIKNRVDLVPVVVGQTEFIRRRTFDMWMRFAYAYGDTSYIELSEDNKPLFPAYRTYHEES